MAKLPELLAQASVIDSDLTKFLETIDEYSEDEQYKQIEQFYLAQIESQTNISEKVEKWCWAILNIDSRAEFYRAQAKRFAQLAKTAENQSKSMKGFLKVTIESQGGKLPTASFPKLSVRKTAASLQIDDEYSGEVPNYLIKPLPLSELLDKEQVRKILNAGNELAFARFAEQGRALYGLK